MLSFMEAHYGECGNSSSNYSSIHSIVINLYRLVELTLFTVTQGPYFSNSLLSSSDLTFLDRFPTNKLIFSKIIIVIQ
jgi:hypothetical protein